MKIDQKPYLQLMKALMGSDGLVYDGHARIFPGKNGTEHAPFTHESVSKDGLVRTYAFGIYAAVNGIARPVTERTLASLIDPDHPVTPPVGNDLCGCPYESGVANLFERDLAVLARDSAVDGLDRKLWTFSLVRAVGEKDGFINDDLVVFLANEGIIPKEVLRDPYLSHNWPWYTALLDHRSGTAFTLSGVR